MRHLVLVAKLKYLVIVAALLLTTPCFGQSAAASEATQKTCPAPPQMGKQPMEKIETPAGTADLPSVLAAVQAALKCYEDHRGSGPDSLPELQKAVFDFQTTTGKVGGIELDFFIFKLKASHEKDDMHVTTFTYVRPKPTPGGAHPLKTKRDPQLLSDDIVARMQAAASAVKEATKMGDLNFNQLDMKIQFGIKNDGSAAASVPVQLVTIGPSIDYNKNDVQTVTLSFAKPE
jgi:hypothetical protein